MKAKRKRGTPGEAKESRMDKRIKALVARHQQERSRWHREEHAGALVAYSPAYIRSLYVGTSMVTP